MILDGLPLELMREVLLDLPTVDIIQTVKCTPRLYHFTKADKALSRRLQKRVFNLGLCLANDGVCANCGKLVYKKFYDIKYMIVHKFGLMKSFFLSYLGINYCVICTLF